jgi:2-C-methyl-D-erythritol 4-phosphate cytidylyltransferase
MLATVAEMRAFAIVLAAGSGTRLGVVEPKAFLPIGGRPMLALSAAAAAASVSIDGLVVAVPPGFEERAKTALADLDKPVIVVVGAVTRQGSVRIALEAVPESVDVVTVHDAARPFARPELFTSVVTAVVEGAEGAVPVVPVADTVKRVRDGMIVGTEPREDLVLAQTPQAFRAGVLRTAHERAAAEGYEATDDAALLEWAGSPACTVEGDPANVKITTPEDFRAAGARLESDRA